MGGKRKTEQDYYTLAEKRGFAWLGREFPKNINTKTIWRCSRGHEWETRYNHILRGSGCPRCVNRVSKATKDYHNLAKEYGFEWIGPKVPNTKTKTWWRCPIGHEWETTYTALRGCPHCFGNAPLLKEDYYKLARDRNSEWVGEELPQNSKIKTWWRCFSGHEWETSHNALRGCPHCAGNVSKVIKDYHDLARGCNFEWVGEELPRDIHTKTAWRCQKGHGWETSYNNIQQGYGCPHCYGNAPLTIEDYYNLAERCGFVWIGKELPPNNSTKTKWRCSGGHEWEAMYRSIQQGTGCPRCVDIINGHRVSKLQRRLCEMLDGKLNYPCGSYRIDVALPNKGIAIEYDCWFWHGHKQEYDIGRDQDLLAAGWKILHIKTNNSIPPQWELDEAVAKLENGERELEIMLDDWGKGTTFAEVRAQKKVDPWEKGPIPISWDGGATFNGCQQLNLWRGNG